jgi:CheY-like chemotaxis protein
MSTTSPRKPFRLLIAEDDPDDRDFIESALQICDKNLNTRYVFNGEELMHLLQSAKTASGHVPNLILLDLNMPRKTGMEVLKELKDDKDLCDIPIVILSSSHNPHIIKETYCNGANCYISKPETDASWGIVMNNLIKFWRYTAEVPYK